MCQYSHSVSQSSGPGLFSRSTYLLFAAPSGGSSSVLMPHSTQACGYVVAVFTATVVPWKLACQCVIDSLLLLKGFLLKERIYTLALKAASSHPRLCMCAHDTPDNILL